MLIIPVTGKISAKNPPWATIGIILLNGLVFFVFQSGDSRALSRAMEYYFDSGLGEIECRHFVEYEKRRHPEGAGGSGEVGPGTARGEMQKTFLRMREDDRFLVKLRQEEIIAPGHEDFDEWRAKRDWYEEMLARVTFLEFGFTPADGKPLTFLTSMFLHGGFMHLLGNMVFLWLVGCVLELWCGRAFFLAMYLVTGVAAAAFFGLVHPASTVPCVGASGAIAGLMGAYAVPFGRKKINVFYSLGFYFNYARAPAILLLPLWIGKEAGMMLLDEGGRIAYAAHLGGLLSGAILAYLNLRVFGRIREDVGRENPTEQIPALLEEAYAAMEKLDMTSARALLLEILALDPDHSRALTGLYNIDKLDPGGEAFVESASRLLDHFYKQNDVDRLYETYRETVHRNRNLPLKSDMLFRLSTAFLNRKHIAESEKIIALLLKKAPDQKKLPTALLNLGKKYLSLERKDKGVTCLKVLRRRYPDSPEFTLAGGILEKFA